MPKDLNLTASTTWAPSVMAPEGGDQRRASTVEAPFQQLTDRTAYLKDKVDVTGVNRIRYTANATTAAAITGLSEGDFVVVGARGLYRFWPAGSSAYNFRTTQPFVINVTAGGKLCLVGASSADVVAGGSLASAPVWTDETGKIRDLNVIPNRIVAQGGASSGTGESDMSYDSCTGTTWADLTDGVTPMLVSLGTLAAGDVVRVRATGGAEYLGTDANAWIRARILYGATEATVPGAAVRIQTNYPGYAPWAISGRYVMPMSDGAVEIRLQGRAGDNTLRIKQAISLDVDVIRP